jgi:hypothetical protein
MITTKAELAQALKRLRGRDPEALAVFILSLAQDSGGWDRDGELWGA